MVCGTCKINLVTMPLLLSLKTWFNIFLSILIWSHNMVLFIMGSRLWWMISLSLHCIFCNLYSIVGVGTLCPIGQILLTIPIHFYVTHEERIFFYILNLLKKPKKDISCHIKLFKINISMPINKVLLKHICALSMPVFML